MKGSSTRENSKRKEASPSELSEAMRTSQQTICFEFENLESTRHQRMSARDTDNINRKACC